MNQARGFSPRITKYIKSILTIEESYKKNKLKAMRSLSFSNMLEKRTY